MRTVRVLIVDDSASMRALIANTLSHDPAIAVVGQASNPLEARQAVKELNPDVMTLDVEMPEMGGVQFLEKVMRLRPLPVVMISSLTQQGAAAAVEALELGAVACFGKPTPGQPDAFRGLAETVKAAAGVRVERRGEPRAAKAAEPSSSYRSDGRLVAIGASTGGVEALIEVISRYPANCPPTVIAIHMPAHFTDSFARRLDSLTPARVAEARDGAPLREGEVLVAPGGVAHLAVANKNGLRCRLAPQEPVNGHRPSVDVLFQSIAKACGPGAVGVILTGMGRDGAAGLLEMRKAGAETLGQDERTSIVYGMPKVAFELGAVERRLPLYEIGPMILTLTSKDEKRELTNVARR